MKKTAALFLSILLLTSFTLAQPEQDNPRPPRAEKGIINLLKLSPDQEKTFSDLAYKHQLQVIDLRAKIQKNRLELKKMLVDGNVDEKKIFQLSDDNSKLQGDMKYSTTKRWIETYKILNDEQKSIWTKHLLQITNPQNIRERIRGGMRNFMMGMRDMDKQ